MVVAHTVLALGEQTLPNANHPFVWMRPALTRCPARRPIVPRGEDVVAAAHAYLTVYRGAPTADTPHPVVALLLGRASRSIGPPVPTRPRQHAAPSAPPTPRPDPVPRCPDDQLLGARRRATSEPIALTPDRKPLRDARAQELSAALAGQGACTDQQKLWAEAESLITRRPSNGRKTPAAQDAFGLCATCHIIESCRRWATIDLYTGIAAGTIFRDGIVIAVGALRKVGQPSTVQRVPLKM